ncbi:DNA polymerase III subunit delta' [Brooklawnia cerclae]|uniref:DNA polymerase-3 subunit delta n=1 Tax=Brooklawnia cerclae TaxID=349934 RepID=A0ABX0SAV9_9ACTN|nr:DNA polymerase III subunit delta' [Brooklawnia cerclae]NIH55532.1 DNA polymerase-3 subunit delta' [Brooklawnia cerclae]
MNATGTALAGVWADLVGQQRAVAVLGAAARAARSGDAARRHAMTHAWLVTGPPGSGRSNAARAFAAALLCERGGCGECPTCRTVLSGAHPDVTIVRTELLSIGVEEVRGLVLRAAMSPTVGDFQVIVVEDSDRITDRGADALLKSLEEPPARTVWVLCAPTADDVIVTIRSRTRQVNLRTPTDEDVTRLLIERDGVDPGMAMLAARAAQGHVGRARALARDERVRDARHAVLTVPGQLTSVAACLQAAEALVGAASQEAKRRTGELDSRELAELKEALGFGSRGARPRQAQAAIRELEDQQKMRAKRLQRDELDRVLTELTTWYRDVLAVQLGAVDAADPADSASGAGLINAELRDRVTAAAHASTPQRTIRRVDAILAARQALEHSVAPLLAMEALLLSLADPD